MAQAQTMIARINDPKGQYRSQRDVTIIVPKIETRGAWNIVVKGRYSVVIYDRNGNFKEVVERTAYPRQSFGAWMVWAIKYGGKGYNSMVDDIYPYLEVVEGQYHKKGIRTTKEPSILISDLRRT